MAKQLIPVTISFILLGLIFSYLVSGTVGWWARYYYVWDKGKDVLLVMCLITRVRGYHLPPLKALLCFLIVRLLWELLAIPDYQIASSTEVIDVLFAMALGLIVLLYFYGIYKTKINE